MHFIFSDDVRRSPYHWYAQVREASPVLHDPRSGMWMLFDYESVKRAMDDHETFSSVVHLPTGRAQDWLVFLDPPRHSKLRAEARVALTHLFERMDSIALASGDPWEPRKALHVHGPAHLPIRFTQRA
jgi:cytochrome P450